MHLVCHPRRLRGPMDAPNMTLGHFVLVRDCVWSSGDALVGLGDRAAACSRSTRGGSEGRESTSAPERKITGSAPRMVHCTSLLFALRSSRRRRRPHRVARAPLDDQPQCLTSPQCPRNMLGQSSRLEGRLGCPHVVHRIHVKKTICFAIKNDH